MGNVIAWPAQSRRRRARTPQNGEAKILFFTGIRYIRDLDAADATAQTNATNTGSEAQALAAM